VPAELSVDVTFARKRLGLPAAPTSFLAGWPRRSQDSLGDTHQSVGAGEVRVESAYPFQGSFGVATLSLELSGRPQDIELPPVEALEHFSYLQCLSEVARLRLGVSDVGIA